MRTALPVVALLALSACATGSYVAPISTGEATPLADGIIDFTASRLSNGEIALVPAQAPNSLTPELERGLRQAGFSVVAPGTSGAHRLRYLVTPLDDGDLVRITLDDDVLGARFFARSRWGGLAPAGPFTVGSIDAGTAP